MFRHILVPLDGSLRAERAIPVAAHIARASEGTVILQRTIKSVPKDGQEASTGLPFFRAEIQSEKAEVQRYLTGIASDSSLTDLPLIVLEPQGSIVADIQATIQTYQVDLLVCCEQLAPQGAYAFADSLAGQLCQHLSIPLLLLPGQEAMEGGGSLESLTGIVIFKGAQPEPALIQSATSLLAALADHGLEYLHFVPQGSVNSQFSKARAGGQPSPTRWNTLSLQEGHTDEQPGKDTTHIQHEVFILEMPPQDGADRLPQEMGTSPRLLVPTPERESHA